VAWKKSSQAVGNADGKSRQENIIIVSAVHDGEVIATVAWKKSSQTVDNADGKSATRLEDTPLRATPLPWLGNP